MSARLRARALLSAWAFALLPATGLWAQDILLSAKERTTSITLGDVAYQPGDGFKLGPLRLHPFLRQSAEWNDNLLLAHSDRVMGSIYQATAGMRVDFLPGNHEFSAGYKGRLYKCIWKQAPDFDDAAEKALSESRIRGLDRVEHVAEVRGVLAFPKARYTVEASWESLSDPLSFEFAGQIGRQITRGAIAASLKMNRFLFESEAEINWLDFRDQFAYMDSLSWKIDAEGGVNIGAKLNAFFAWSWNRNLYNRLSAAEIALYGDHSDFESHSLSIGVKGTPVPKLDANVKAGVSFSRTIEGPARGDISTSMFGSLYLKYSLTENTSFEAAYLRQFGISLYSSYQVIDRGEIKAVYAFSLRVAARVYGFLENTAPVNRPAFLRVGAGVQVEYRAYGWMSLGVGYEWSSRHSSEPDSGFTNSRVWLHVTVYF